ncbi:SPASM domain-containing protein [Streptomyces mobaraensis]|uniref:Radical SAM protein n=1 Tax=Streptomyces mobaraensis (strain ATCC 29032 / DSM 40847 / JCM 4168 / NBRC 13819 / NCIMB 11159 / IPCR 16-22) TaxID=1223523 RepID=M3BSD0_STRM1|nr:SPASM domain-containing protein [Streptomyces mobaraensis]EMF02605.1 radical SAM protein [Streptomyces mobaraensis NBRC 13819 = DSM 40847]
MDDTAGVRSHDGTARQDGRRCPAPGLEPAHSPRKVLAHGELLRRFVEGREIRPVHVRLDITGPSAISPPESRDGTDAVGRDTGNSPSESALPTAKAASLLRGFAASGGRAVTFHGIRETTRHPGYPAVCDAGHEAGLRLGLVTDGSRLGRPDTAECVASTHTWVRVTLPAGTEATFRTGGREAGRTTLASLLDDVGNLRQSAIDPDFRIGFHYVITERNRGEILAAAHAARESGAHYIRFDTGPYAYRAGTAPALRQAALLEDDAFEVRLPRPADDPDGDTGEARFRRCHYSRFTVAVDSGGRLSPCPRVSPDPRYGLGDVATDGWPDVLAGAARTAWQATDPRTTALCGSCSYRPQNELLELLLDGRVALDDALGAYAAEVPSTLHADFL